MRSSVLLSWCCFNLLAARNPPVLKRHIEKTGLHRDLVTSLKIPVALLPDIHLDEDLRCYILFTETFPTGAYVDPDQIKSLKPYGGPDVLLTSAVDVEKPEFESTGFLGLVFSNLSKVDGTWIGGYTLPVHLRYHAVSRQDFVNVTFSNPEIAVRCINKEFGLIHHGYHGDTVRQKSELCGSSSVLLCDWVVIQYLAEKTNISVEVPVGKAEHYLLVTVGTVLTTLLGCFLLVYVSLHVGKTKVS